MSTEIIDFKTPGKPFEFEVQSFVVLSFDFRGTTLIEYSNEIAMSIILIIPNKLIILINYLAAQKTIISDGIYKPVFFKDIYTFF